MRHKNILLVGNSGSGKTRSLITLMKNQLDKHRAIDSQTSLYEYVITVDDGTRNSEQVRIKFWDASDVADYSMMQFIPVIHMDCTLIFVNLTHHRAYSTLDAWKRKYVARKNDMMFMVIGTVIDSEETEQIRINKVKTLEWCANNDVNFIELNIYDRLEVFDMYEDIVRE